MSRDLPVSSVFLFDHSADCQHLVTPNDLLRSVETGGVSDGNGVAGRNILRSVACLSLFTGVPLDLCPDRLYVRPRTTQLTKRVLAGWRILKGDSISEFRTVDHSCLLLVMLILMTLK